MTPLPQGTRALSARLATGFWFLMQMRQSQAVILAESGSLLRMRSLPVTRWFSAITPMTLIARTLYGAWMMIARKVMASGARQGALQPWRCIGEDRLRGRGG